MINFVRGSDEERSLLCVWRWWAVNTLEQLTTEGGFSVYIMTRNFSILKTRLNLQAENSDSRELGWGTFLGVAHLLTAATRAGAALRRAVLRGSRT